MRTLFFIGAALCLHLSISPLAVAQSLPPPSRTVFKCEFHGRLVYSDSPCLGAKRMEVEPSRGLTTMPGARAGADVRREQQREAFAEAVRPLTGLDAKQLEAQGRRNKLPADAQRECRSLDNSVPILELRENDVDPQGRSVLQTQLLRLRQRFRELRC